MKIFQILNSICHWDATPEFPTLASTRGSFAPDIMFVEAPDYVHEGWGYDEDAQGDERFIQPVPPDGWLYDTKTGTFYRDGDIPPSEQKTALERIAQLEAELAALKKQVPALAETEVEQNAQ